MTIDWFSFHFIVDGKSFPYLSKKVYNTGYSTPKILQEKTKQNNKTRNETQYNTIRDRYRKETKFYYRIKELKRRDTNSNWIKFPQQWSRLVFSSSCWWLFKCVLPFISKTSDSLKHINALSSQLNSHITTVWYSFPFPPLIGSECHLLTAENQNKPSNAWPRFKTTCVFQDWKEQHPF